MACGTHMYMFFSRPAAAGVKKSVPSLLRNQHESEGAKPVLGRYSVLHLSENEALSFFLLNSDCVEQEHHGTA